MPSDAVLHRLLAGLTLLLLGALLVLRVSAFGIWDPWELGVADGARTLLAGEPAARFVSLGHRAVAQGFAWGGVGEAAGRLPIVAFAVLALGVAYALGRVAGGARVALYGVVIAGTSPLFVLNARQMLGVAPAFFSVGALGLGLAVLLRAGWSAAPSRDAALGAGLALVGGVLAASSTGLLQGVLPAVLASALAVWLTPGALPGAPEAARRMTLGLTALGAAFAVLTGLAFVKGMSPDGLWIATAGDPPATTPTFEVTVERLFHAFVPWGALLPAAFFGAGAQPVHGGGALPEDASRRLVRAFLGAWCALSALAFAWQAGHAGPATYLAVVPLAVLVALGLAAIEESRAAAWLPATVAALLTALALRDYMLYPSSPLAAIASAHVEVPDGFRASRLWVALLGAFAATAFLCLGVEPGKRALALRAPYAGLRSLWGKSWGHRVWLVVAALLLLACVVLAVVAATAGTRVGLTTVAVKWAIRLGAVPIALPFLVALGQLVVWGVARLGRARMAPVLAVGLVLGGFVAQGLLPTLSAHFSPRAVYDRYNKLAKASEPLGEYRVGGRAAAYYVTKNLTELRSQEELVRFLAEPGRRWAVIPADELAAIDRSFRKKTGKHLFIADNTSATVVLAASEAVGGVENRNFAAEAVRKDVPTMQHPLAVNFDDKIELLGYDLALPHAGHVGAGETLTVTWYWRAKRGSLGAWKIFVHGDGQGLRLNGDHEPVDGKYPVRLWEEGDVVVDRQELKIPSNYRAGDYTLFVGFYQGDDRLKVTSGPSDGDNRAKAVTFRIR